MPSTPGDKARNQLLSLEQRRQAAVFVEFAKIRKRLDAELLDLLARIAKQRKMDGNASPGLLIQKARLNEMLDAIDAEINKSAAKFAKITETAQRSAIDIAKAQAEATPGLQSNLFLFDAEATSELIGIAGDGSPLGKHFAKIARPARQAMFDALFFGIAAGKPNAFVAREVRDAIGGTAAHAMTIVRTETNRAYRESSRKAYAAAPGVIGWRWLAATEATPPPCPICWANHGRIFATKTKFGTHPNCRCTMVPVFEGDALVQTGPEIFAELTAAQKRAILGPGRLELYMQGAELRDFVESTKTTFGIGRRVKPISRTTFKRLKPEPAPTPKPALRD